MIITFKLVREHLLPTYTIGHLYYRLGDEYEWQYFCDTLEDQVRPDGIKIYGETAIPYGHYKFMLVQSPHFRRILPWIMDVPGFIGIMIHQGNSNRDTLGCILVGQNKIKGGLINSTETLDKLMDLLKQYPQNQYDLIITNK